MDCPRLALTLQTYIFTYTMLLATKTIQYVNNRHGGFYFFSNHLNSLAPGRCIAVELAIGNFQSHIKARYLEHFLQNCPGLNATRHH